MDHFVYNGTNGLYFMDHFVYTGTNVLYFCGPVCVDWN